MSSIIGTAVAAFVAALQAAPAVCPDIDRTLLRPLSAGTREAIVVRPLGAQPSETDQMGRPISWEAVVAADCYARASGGQTADEAVDALIVAMYARVMADQTLGGAVRWIQPRDVLYEYAAEKEPSVCATFTFTALLVGAPSTFTP